MRHGEAVDERDAGYDSARWLTAVGRVAASKAGEVLAREGTRVDNVVVSPFVRAVQTAELAAQGLGYRGAIAVADALTPDGAVADVLRVLAKFPRGANVLLVGHEPSMHRIAGALLGGANFPAFDKAEVCAFVWVEGQRATLEWRLNPSTLSFEK